MGKSLKVVPPQGYEIDVEKSTFDEIIFRKVEPKLPMSFEELGGIRGWYIESDTCRICEQRTPLSGISPSVKDVWPTKELAEASLAMSQLMQLRKAWVGDWEADWVSGQNWCVCVVGEILCVSFRRYNSPLSFPTREMGVDFLHAFLTITQTAKPLL